MGEYSDKITRYHGKSGREAFADTLDAVAKRVEAGGINKVLLFSANTDSIALLKERLSSHNVRLLVVGFPYKHRFRKADTDEVIIPETSLQEGKRIIADLGVDFIQGVMPFEEVLLPGGMPGSLSSIFSQSMSLISHGLILCISSIIMACESGYLEPGEITISCAADTSIVASACDKRMLFHPKLGLDIQEIISKPMTRLL